MSKKELEKQVNKFAKTIAKGDVIKLKQGDKELARYEFTEWSIDAKTPIDWLRGCLVFDVSMRGIDIGEVSLEFEKQK